MVEHSVQHHPDPGLMQALAYLRKILVASKPAVNFSEIPCIIAVGIGFKYRRKIDGVRAGFPDMRDPLLHLPDPGLFHTVVFKRRSAEAKRIDLIKHTFVCPHFL